MIKKIDKLYHKGNDCETAYCSLNGDVGVGIEVSIKRDSGTTGVLCAVHTRV
jgi:hypothetical protein